MALGVLIGLRQCSEDVAFEDIAQAVHRTGVGLGTLARALVALATGTDEPFPHREEALSIWGDLISNSDAHGRQREAG